MAGKVKWVHTNDIKLAEINEWEGAKEKRMKRGMRKATLVESKELETNDKEGEEEIMIPPKGLEKIKGFNNFRNRSLEEDNEAGNALRIINAESEEEEISLPQ